jgi:hypothetical protein
MSRRSDYSLENVNRICEMVAQGMTLRQISAELGYSLGTLLNWTTKPEHIEQYTRARESAADIFETDIIEAALSAGPETAASDRVKIDALKWVAARRAPKKYGDRITHGGDPDAPINHQVGITVTFHDPDKAG